MQSTAVGSMAHTHGSYKGFHGNGESGVTLVELSVVLVILSLLTAGVISGAALMRGAETRSIISEYQKFQAGIATFHTTYGALPGDMADAAEIWGMAPNAATPAANDAACAALNNTRPSQGKRTCNGDNDGAISVGYEEFRAWQQLANAGMIGGNYNGVGGTSTAGEGYQADINCPKSTFRDGCWRVFYRDSTPASLTPFNLFHGDYESHLFSLWGGALTETPFTPLFLPKEMRELDSKVDDGMPATGSVIAPHGNSSGAKPYDKCTKDAAGGQADATEDTALYNVADTSRACQLYIKANF